MMTEAMGLPPQALAEVVVRQSSVVSRAQLTALGVDRRVPSRRIAAGRWQAVGPRVVVFHGGPLTQQQRWWVGVLHAGPGACLAGLSAAGAGGLTGWERVDTHVVVPKGTRVPRLDGLVVHESRRLGAADVHPVRLPPQTRMARSLIDGAAWMARAEHGCGVLAAGVQQRLVRPGELRAALGAVGSVRHRRILAGVLGDIEGGAHSLAEISVVRLCRRAGLVAPSEQQFRYEASGRCRYLDAVWWLSDGSRLVLEVDGGLHLRVGSWWRDLSRERDIVIRVGRVLRCSTVEIRVQPDAIAGDLARAGVPYTGHD